MKKSMKKYLTLFVAGCTLASALTMSACAEQCEDYSANLGEVFTFACSSSADITVKSPSGEKIDVFMRSFVPLTEGEYRYIVRENGTTCKGRLFVADEKAPEIVTSFAFRYVAVGEAAKLPTVTVSDYNGGAVTTDLSVKKGEETITLSGNSFTPTEEGDYLLVIAAEDAAGNRSEKTVIFNAVNDLPKLSSVTAFDHEYGVNQVSRRHGFAPSYTSEVKYGNENGSLKMEFTADTQYEGWFFLRDVLIRDISESHGLYFYVYNESGTEKKLYVNRSHEAVLQPNAWTEIRITDYTAFLGNSYFAAIKENFSLEDVNGLLISVIDTEKNLEMQNYYFSNIYIVQ